MDFDRSSLVQFHPLETNDREWLECSKSVPGKCNQIRVVSPPVDLIPVLTKLRNVLLPDSKILTI